MSFLSGFAGAAAQTYDESLKGWKALFQEEERLDESRRQFDLEHKLRKDQAAAETSRWAAEFDWRKDIETLRQNLAEETFQSEQLNGFYTKVIGELPTLAPEEKLELYATFMDTFGTDPVGAALGNVLEARISSTDYISRTDALGGLNAIMNSAPGTLVFSPIVDSYMAALTEEEQAQFAPMVEAWKEGNLADWETFAETARQLNGLAVTEKESEINARDAAAAASNAQATAILGEWGITSDKYENFDVPMLQNALTVSSNEAIQSTIDTEYYPQTAAVNLRAAIAGAKTEEARAQVAGGTVRAQIDTIVATSRTAAAEAGIAEEDLRFNLATSGFREAIISWEATQAEETVYQIRAYIDVLEDQVVDSEFKREQASFEMVSALVESGSIELLDTVGEDVLRLAFGDNWETVRDDLADRAFSQRDILDRRAMASVIFEEMQAEDMTWRAENNERVYLDGRGDEMFDRTMAQEEMALRTRGVAVEEGRLALAQKDSAWQQAFAEKKWAADVREAATAEGTTRNDQLNAVRIATDIAPSDLAEFGAQAADLMGLRDQLGNLAELYATNPNEAQVVAEGLTPLLTDYGIDPLLLADAASIQIAAGFVENSLQAKRDHFIRSAGIFMTNAYGLGVAVTPEELGLNLSLGSDAALWEQINLQQGSVRFAVAERDEAFQAIAPALEGVLTQFAPALYVDGNAVVTADTVEAVYNAAVSATSAEELEAAGITSPADMAEAVRAKATEYQTLRDQVETYSDYLTTIGIQLDYSNPEVMNAAASTMNAKVGTALRIEEGVAGLRVPETAMVYQQNNFLGMGNPFAPQVEAVAGGQENLVTSHQNYIADIQEVYGVPVAELMQYGFVSQLGQSATNQQPQYVITNPVGLASMLQQYSAAWTPVAQALADINRY